jgi:hypothetical protein
MGPGVWACGLDGGGWGYRGRFEIIRSLLNLFDEFLPNHCVYFVAKGFFNSALDCFLSRSHFILFQAFEHPHDGFKTDHFKFKAVEIVNMGIGSELSLSGMEDPTGFSFGDEILCFLLSLKSHFLHEFLLKFRAL